MSLWFFISSAKLFLFLYGFLIIASDLTVASLFATLGIIAAGIFRLKFVLPNHGLSKLWKVQETTPNNETTEFSNGTDGPTQKPFIAAHRTLALECPENSLSGIRKTKLAGFNAVEFDVRFSKDDELILFHDGFIDRVTNGSGKVDELSLAQLQSLDISGRHLLHKTFENEKVPTLKEAIEECLALNLNMIIDVKSPNAKMVTALSEFYKNHNDLHNKSMVVCVSPTFLYKFKKRNPMVTTGLVWRPHMLSLNCPTGNLDHGSPRFREKWKQLLAVVSDPVIDWTFNNILWQLCSADVFLCHRDVVSRQYARMWKRRNVPILAWPVNNPIEKTYFSTVLQVGYLTDTHVPFT